MALTSNNVQNVKFLRNGQIFTGATARSDARAALETNKGLGGDGTAILARYSGTSDTYVKTIVGFIYATGDTKNVTIFDIDDVGSDVQKAIDEINTKIGTGITTANTATSQLEALSGGTNDTSASTSVKGAKIYASAYTESAIDKLEVSDTAVEGEYVSQVSETDGKIAVVRAALPSATTVSGDSKVIIDVTQDKGKITASAANITGIKLDGYTEGTDADIASTDTLGQALGKLQAQINAMDLTAVSGEGEVITSISEEDGKVSASKTAIKDVKLNGYAKDTTATGAIVATDDIEAALNKLENKAAAITIANKDGSINVTTDATGTDINVNIKSGEHVIAKTGDTGIYTDLDLVKITTGLPTTVKERYQLLATDDSQIGVDIDIYKDSSIVSITYITDPADAHYQNLEYVYIDASGETQTEYVDISSLVLEAEFASGITVTNHVAHGVVDSASEKDESNVAFLTVGADGFKVSGIKDAIDTKINKLGAVVTGGTTAGTATSNHVQVIVGEADGKLTGVTVSETNIANASDLDELSGKSVTAVEMTGGTATTASTTDGTKKITINADGSSIKMTGYAKGSASGAVEATDSVNAAIGKLENQIAGQIDALDADISGNSTHVTVGVEEVNGKITAVTVSESNIANADDLSNEIAHRKAVDGVDGNAYTADTNANYISGASSLYGADQALDSALNTVDNAMLTGVTAGNGIIVGGKANKSQTISAKVKNDGGLVVDSDGLHLGYIDAGMYDAN